MSTSKSKPPNYSPPIIFRSLQEHKYTLIILHGRGSTAEKFAEPLLKHPVSPLATPTNSYTTSNTANYKSFQDHLPHAKFIFPTAPTEPELKQHLQVQGLRETAEYLHDLLREEIEDVGPENVVLMGLSQGCAASIVATMLWQGSPFGAVVGMCGYLPFRKDMFDYVQGLESESTKGLVLCQKDDEQDIFERSSNEYETKTKLESAIGWLQEELHVNLDGARELNHPSIQSIPVFMGHGVDDAKVPIERGRTAADFLRLVDVDVEWKQYEDLDHWYSEAMLQDVVRFLQDLKGWESCASPAKT